ncbi:dienelactone hydrolase family protein [Novosphingobium decolorationis]|uniref:Dienelactone hydrolase family protein n=1 Tax=Novosphingobium decolorationis TaxID=2698673 RepID=A0ABX8E0C9_9SPHN|nr:dienelactone hydrolase family protein [Novosphingobium decolorationis]QVM82533.1 dienelactone hydrolase family protein [Novosphingobium decolorationis]
MSDLSPYTYRHAGTELTGWIARPVGAARAALVLFPTIMNITPAIERRAAMYAELGFLVLVADFYGEPVADFEASRGLAEALRTNVKQYRGRIGAAIAALRDVPEAEDLPLLAAGYCMGGQAVLEAARDRQPLRAGVSFHGLLSTDSPAHHDSIATRLLICHGDADPMVPRDQVLSFWEEMDHGGADWHFHAYSGVRHGFTDPGSDARGSDAIGYDASADRQSWAAMRSFFDDVLETPSPA